MTNKSHNSNILFRLIAKLIDLMLVFILWEIFSKAGLLLGVLYFLLSDGLLKGKSIGKFFLRLKVINTAKNTSADFRDSIVRNLSLAIALLFLKIPIIGVLIFIIVFAFELILIIGDSDSKRLGDYLANTSVIEE